MEFNGVKVFTESVHWRIRDVGDQITEWIRLNHRKRPVSCTVQQSSDADRHCLSIVLFYKETTT